MVIRLPVQPQRHLPMNNRMTPVGPRNFLAGLAALAVACNAQLYDVGMAPDGEPVSGGLSGTLSGGTTAVASGGTNFEDREVLQCHAVSLGSDVPSPDDACRAEAGGYLPCGSPCVPTCGNGGEGGQREECAAPGPHACDRARACVLVR